MHTSITPTKDDCSTDTHGGETRCVVPSWLLHNPPSFRVEGILRYLGLYVILARLCLMREMIFHQNFLLRCAVHSIWLSLMLVFLNVICLHTRRIGNWDRPA